jgi:murein L,D-transpeptidase YcbB/YkuD
MRKLHLFTAFFILLSLYLIPILKFPLLSKKSNISTSALFYYPINDTLNQEAILLQKYLARYNEIAKMGSFQKIKNIHLKIALGDISSTVRIVKNNLFLLGDLKLNNNSSKFDSSLYEAIISFQERHGMKLTGKISSNFIVELNRPIQSIIDQIRINIDRLNKLNTKQYKNIFIVNIPEFILHVYENGQIKSKSTRKITITISVSRSRIRKSI